MGQKSVINDPKTVVKEMLEGISYSYPGLHIDPAKGVIMLNKDRKNKVALVCGSGAGYEPYAAGFVGEGMLTCYISGKIAAPPRSDIILSVLVTLAKLNRGGVLVLILNHPQELLNFGLAIERARFLGIQVESLVFVDDCSRWKAMREERYTNLAYKKGLSGCVFALKILGAFSCAGASMCYLVSEARALNFRTATLGFCLEPFCYPGSHEPLFNLNHNEIVIGLGLNGENGTDVIEFTTAEAVVKNIMPVICEESKISKKSVVIVLINSMSSMTIAETYILAKEVDKYLRNKKVAILKQIVGRFFTSYDAKGAHISILNVTGKVDEWLSCLEQETDAYAWPNLKLSATNKRVQSVQFSEQVGPEPKSHGGMQLDERESLIFRKCIAAACDSFIDAEDVLNQLNAYHGNGDLGSKLKMFSLKVLRTLKTLPANDVSLTFQILERLAETTMMGTIGAVYSALLLGASEGTENWPNCFLMAVRFLGIHVPIASGYGTLFDVIKPACADFNEYHRILGPEFWRTTLQLSVDTAERACCQTSKTIPKIGVYNPTKPLNMDPGAYSVVVWMRAVNDMLKKLLPLSKANASGGWSNKFQALLLSMRPPQHVSSLKHKYELGQLQAYLPFILEEEEEEEESYIVKDI